MLNMGVIIKFISMMWLVLIVSAQTQIWEDTNKTNEIESNEDSEVLSRRKRFIVFPEGSSVQLVFCNTFPVITSIGDIFLWGYTAALAFELPQDPYSPFDHHADPLHRRVDTKTIYYTDEDGRIMYKRNYKRKLIVNPAFAKRSVDTKVETEQFKKGTAQEFKIDRKQMHASKHSREFLKRENMDERTVEFHRSSRAKLYGKIETMLRGLGGDGRHCMLKTLCLVGQSQNLPQGSFFQEILRATFTLPKGQFEEQYNKEYDTAYWSTGSCDTLYPECDELLSDPINPSLSY